MFLNVRGLGKGTHRHEKVDCLVLLKQTWNAELHSICSQTHACKKRQPSEVLASFWVGDKQNPHTVLLSCLRRGMRNGVHVSRQLWSCRRNG